MTTLKKTIDYSFTPGAPLKPAVYETTCTNVPDVPPPVPPGPNPGGALGISNGIVGNFPTIKIVYRSHYLDSYGNPAPAGDPNGHFVVLPLRTFFCVSGQINYATGRCK